MIYVLAIILHFTFDWILQPREVAKKKSQDKVYLMKHIDFQVFPYIGLLYIFLVLIKPDQEIWLLFLFVLMNLLAHGLIDWYLPKIYPAKDSERRLINQTAIDQMLHLTILLGSINYLLNGN